jgi:Na+/H+-dicarboxylate symporter
VFGLKKIKLHTKIFIGLILGVVVGLVFGEKAMIIEPVGTIFLRLITMIVVPLVLVSLMLGTASLGDIRKLGRIGFKTVAYFTITTMIAISIGLGLANIVKPGTGLNEEVKAELYKSYESKAQDSIQRMTERTGTTQFSTEELHDPEELVFELRDDANPLMNYFREQLSPQTAQMLDEYNRSHPPSNLLKNALVKDLNRLLEQETFFKEELFAGVDLSKETKNLLKANHLDKEFIRLNRLLIEDAFPDIITKRKKSSPLSDLKDVLVNIFPTNPLKSLVEGNMLQVIFLALLFGTILTLIKREKSETLIKILEGLNDAIIQVVHFAMKLAPYGVLALIAAVIGQYGVNILVTLLKYSLVVVGGLVIYTFSVNSFSLSLLGRMNPLLFFKAVKEAMIIAFSTSSSNAALPVSLECVEHIGVPRQYSSFVIPLGATINMDGTALYQGVAAVFIANIYSIPLGFTDQITIVLMATLASVGAAGVPAAGIITLAMVLTQIGIPLEGIALILGVDRFLDMCRTTTNIIGDMACSVVIKQTEERGKTKLK